MQRNCIGCHSAHYVQMQPPTLARAYWENTVKRMKKPFGAQFPDEDVAAMVDYLVENWGRSEALSGFERQPLPKTSQEVREIRRSGEFLSL